MIFGCPGSKIFKAPEPVSVKCELCSAETEIWSDEGSVKCPGCGKTIFRNTGQSCLDWCKHARECVGEEVYKNNMYQKQMKGV